jgi:hypothetical protein
MKRQRKMKPPVALLRPSTVKKNLLEKIKDYKRRNEETVAPDQSQPKMTDTDLASQFKTSSNYLEQLMNKKKEGRKAKPKVATAVPQPAMPQPAMLQYVPQPIMPQYVPQPTMHQVVPQPTMHQVVPQVVPQPTMHQVVPQVVPQPTMHQVVPQSGSDNFDISLELPPELQINPIPIVQETPFYMNHMPVVNPVMNAPAPVHAPAPASAPVSAPAPAPVFAPIMQIKNDVPYGCLRNGNKPTYRTYHRKMQPPPMSQSQSQSQSQSHNHNHNHTLKKPVTMDTNAPLVAPINPEIDADETALIQERQRKLRELQEKAANANANANANAIPSPDVTRQPEHTKIQIKQTITKKYRLGRSPGGNVVSVLIKNNDTRRKVQEECGLLKREPIIDVRNYLHDHGLLKVGSDAPPDVIRNMYESAKLTGDVNNVNKNVILHNFMNAANATA